MPLSQTTNLLDDVMSAGPGSQAARDTDQLQLSQQVNKQQPGQTAQQLGAAMASSAGQASLQRTQAVIQDKTGIQQQGLQRQQQQAQAAQSNRELAYQGLAQKNEEKLSQLGIDAKNKIMVANRQFNMDEEGRKYLNQEQLNQYKVAKAQSVEEYKDYASKVQQTYQRQAQFYETLAAKVRQGMQQEFLKTEAYRDDKSKVALANLANYYDELKEKALQKQQEQNSIVGLAVTGITVAASTWSSWGPALMA